MWPGMVVSGAIFLFSWSLMVYFLCVGGGTSHGKRGNESMPRILFSTKSPTLKIESGRMGAKGLHGLSVWILVRDRRMRF